MTDIINVKKAFAYALESSSINYVRNYNFNVATVTDIRLNLFNKDQTTPITVYMSGSVPWVKIKNSNNTDITFPKGNVVLQPSSSQTVLVQIDLPTEIEAVETIAVYPDIRFRVVSGSFPITSAPPPPNTNAIVLNQDLVRIEVNKQSDLIEAYVYDANGVLEASPEVVWTSNNMSIVQIDEEKQGDGESSQIDLPKKHPIKPSIPLTYPKTLLPRREEIKDMITKDGTYLPKSLLHADLDGGFLEFVKNTLKISFSESLINFSPILLN